MRCYLNMLPPVFGLTKKVFLPDDRVVFFKGNGLAEIQGVFPRIFIDIEEISEQKAASICRAFGME